MPGANDQENQNNQSGTDENESNNQNDSSGKGGSGKSNSEEGIASLEDAKKIIKDLRAENAKHRTKGKSQEDSIKSLGDQLGSIKKHLGIKEDVDPAEQVKTLNSRTEELELELSLATLARTNNIPVESDEYFRFQMMKKSSTLKEGEEMSETQIAEVVAEVQKYAGFKKEKPNNNSSGVNEDGKNPAGGGGDKLTPEQFVKMSLAEKSKLRNSNEAEYNRLFAAAKDKKLY